jgi:hypothetical protein
MILIPESALIRQGQLTGIYTIGNKMVSRRQLLAIK